MDELEKVMEEETELPVYEDDLNTSIKEDEIDNLNEEDIFMLIEKIDIELMQYEDIFTKGIEEGKTFEEICDDGYNEDEMLRLKSLKKALYKRKKALKKINTDNSFFQVIPVWAIILFIVVAILTMFPVSPFLPTKFATYLADIIMKIFSDYFVGATVFVLLYHFIFIIIEGIILLVMYKKAKKEKTGLKKCKYFLILICINFALMIYPIITFLIAIS